MDRQNPDYFALIQRAEAAQMLLEHGILKEVLDKLRQQALDELVNAGLTDMGELRGQIRTIDMIRDELQTIINDPKLALHSSRMKRMTGGHDGRPQRR